MARGRAVVALAVVCCLSAHAATLDKRIVGGVGAEAGDVPSMVSIHPYEGSIHPYEGDHICGGVLLDNTTVVTAAHCISWNKVTVHAGSVINDEGISANVIWRTTHPGYKIDSSGGKSGPPLNDIGIYKLETPIRESDTVKYAKLPTAESSPADGATMLIAGWGSTSGRSRFSKPIKHLVKAEVPIVPLRKCRQEVGRLDQDGQLGFDASSRPQLAFVMGIRACWGRRLAQLELRIFTVLVATYYHLLGVHGPLASHEATYDISYRARNGYVALRGCGG